MTGHVAGRLYAVASLAGSFYALWDGTEAVLFDAGLSAAQAAAGLRRLGIPPQAVTHVFLTHSDRDHVGGLALFPRAALYMSVHEQAVIDGTVPRRLLFLKVRNRFPRPYRGLEDEAAVRAGPFTVRALWTPGHTPGSSCYLADGALITGDLLTLRGGRARGSPRIICNDVPANQRSLRGLAARVPAAQVLATGHSGWTLDYRRAMAAFLPPAAAD